MNEFWKKKHMNELSKQNILFTNVYMECVWINKEENLLFHAYLWCVERTGSLCVSRHKEFSFILAIFPIKGKQNKNFG